MAGLISYVVKADTKGLEASQRVMEERFSNPSPAFEGMHRGILAAMREVFRSGGKGTTARGGRFKENRNKPWISGGKMVKPGYRDWKEGTFSDKPGRWWAYRGRKGLHWPEPLSLSGNLQRSLTSARNRNHVWARSGNNEFQFGTKVESRRGTDYALGHMEGRTKRPRMAKRPFLDWKLKGAAGKMWSKAIALPLLRYLFSRSVWSNRAFPVVDYHQIQKDAENAYRTGGLHAQGKVWRRR